MNRRGERVEPSGQASPAPSIVTDVLRTPGRSLDPNTRAFMEPRLGHDLSGVRVHTGAPAALSAQALNAQAYTVGQNIVFGAGRYVPHSPTGRQLLAHELVHVIQQNRHTSQAGPAPNPVMQRDAPAGLIQRHRDAPCPSGWIPIPAKERSVWEPANDAIEKAYANDPRHRGHTVLYGSDFQRGGRPGQALETRLPRGVADQAIGNALLGEFRGVSRQLAPDIIDFTEHVIYEIKTRLGAPAGANQLLGYYRLAGALQIKHGGPAWNPDRVGWYPSHVLPFPGRRDRIVCTEATNYDLWPVRGLILYQVLERKKKEEEKKKKAAQVALASSVPILTALEPKLHQISPQIQVGLQKKVGRVAAGSEYVIIAPPAFYQRFIGGPYVASKLEHVRTHGLDPRRNPAIGLRNLGWTLVGLYAGTMAFVLYAGAAAAVASGGTAAAGAAGASGATAATQTGGVTLATVRLAGQAANDNAVRAVAAAAGVIFVMAIGKEAHAATDFKVDDVQAVRAVPASAVTASSGRDFMVGSDVTYQGKPYFVIGLARAKGTTR
jgi:hypothetical protein